MNRNAIIIAIFDDNFKFTENKNFCFCHYHESLNQNLNISKVVIYQNSPLLVHRTATSKAPLIKYSLNVARICKYKSKGFEFEMVRLINKIVLLKTERGNIKFRPTCLYCWLLNMLLQAASHQFSGNGENCQITRTQAQILHLKHTTLLTVPL